MKLNEVDEVLGHKPIELTEIDEDTDPELISKVISQWWRVITYHHKPLTLINTIFKLGHQEVTVPKSTPHKHNAIYEIYLSSLRSILYDVAAKTLILHFVTDVGDRRFTVDSQFHLTCIDYDWGSFEPTSSTLNLTKYYI